MNNEMILQKIENMYHREGWSVYRLARESGVRQSTLSSIFNKRSTISLANLEKICKAFPISLSEFFAELEDPEDGPVESRYMAMEMAEEMLSMSDRDRRMVKLFVASVLKTDRESESQTLDD